MCYKRFHTVRSNFALFLGLGIAFSSNGWGFDSGAGTRVHYDGSWQYSVPDAHSGTPASNHKITPFKLVLVFITEFPL